MSKTSLTCLCFTFCALLFVFGCGTMSTNDLENDRSDAQSEVATHPEHEIALKIVKKLLDSNVLKQTDGAKTVIMVEPVKKSPFTQIDTHILTTAIRQAIQKSARTRGLGLMTPATNSQVNPVVSAPDACLSGVIIPNGAKTDRQKLSNATLSMSLTDLKTGRTTWSDTTLLPSHARPKH